MYVDFISDEHYKECVRYVLDSFNNAKKLKESLQKAIVAKDIFKSSLFSNVVDPFKMTFEVSKIGVKDWIRKEILRQLDKSVEQKMGEFHQKILGGVDNWTDLKVGQGIDLVNDDKTLFIEIKNKFNTCSDSALKDVRRKLEDITSKKHQATAYWAYIISNSTKKSGEGVWVKKGFNKIESVKAIWGKAVYEKVTGDPDALYKIYKTLPSVIADVTKEDDIKDVSEIIDDIVNGLDDHFEMIQNQIFKVVFG
ncbi:Eco47II family restriction endonuclease [Mucilaginibacter achroorhodeus]|uniref:Eco47II family restriction endonuclease n=1 Tax=Mucilaginibacter achroorhodeus TaxID=2599294 RepID=A0A563TXG1_9SPHI|nr:Eco47II family restriction endonuclease [Mucilaginibacter achroorhodeus]TWR24006.1 Eco47II family restriction endonuclease [Mucilaginibacter achroorhodeus]